ncbi:MAG: response regulator [Snowella sp.]|nr:response regulator [Snowella sp.]
MVDYTPYTILLVDDSPSDRGIYRRWLTNSATEHAAYHIIEAENGEQAVNYCQNQLPDLLLIDYYLPDMTGLAFLKQFRSQFRQPRIPVIVLTGQGSTPIAVELLKHWVEDYLEKDNLTPDHLQRSIAAVLKQFQLQRQLEQAERKNAEGKFWRDVLDSLYIFVGILSPNGRVLEINQAPLKFAGVTKESVLGQPFADTHWWAYSVEVQTTIRQAIKQTQLGKNCRFDIAVQDSEKKLRNIDFIIHPLFDEQGNIRNLIASGIDISDRKRTELALQESEEKFRQLAEVVDAVFWILHLDRTERVYVSPAYERIWGRPCKELFVTPDAWLEAIHPLDRDSVLAAISKQIHGKYDEEYRIIRPDGQIRWIRDRAFPVKNEQDEIYRIAGIAEDITQQKEAELKLQEKALEEQLLREISQRIRQSLDLQTIFNISCQEIRQVLQADRVGIFRFYSDSGYDDGEFVAESVIKGFPSALEICVHDHCFGENYANLYAQGRYFVVDDIYQNGLETCHTNVLAQFEVKANLVMPLLCGTELWGLLCIHQCDGPRHWRPGEVDLTLKLANQLAIAIQQAKLVEQLQQELTERQQAQQQLLISNQELTRATRLKDEFLANMSHELRTPLNAILGMTEGLLEELFGHINKKQRKSLQTVENSASHLLSLINDILDVAKIESGLIELELNSVAIEPLCSSSLAFVKQQALNKRIQLDINLPPYLPNLWVDERRIRQVLINLLTNAVKFTPEGGHVTLTVSQIDSSPNSTQTLLRIAITDTGIGISSENIDKLFKPFVQIDSALNRQYTGTGLGLALVKQLVELHGGRVELTSELEKGSCFSVDLPCDPTTFIPFPSRSVSSIHHQSNHEPMDSVPPSPLILLAEDNPANIITITSYLELKGYRLLIANNGQEAIALAQSQRPDLILMDIQMPEMDGLEAIQHLRCDPILCQIPIIALTALAMKEDRDRCFAAGATDYLSKPVKLKQLATLIQNLLTQEDASNNL